MQNFKYLFTFLTFSFFSTSYAVEIRVDHISDNSGISNLTNSVREFKLWTPTAGAYFGSDASGALAAPPIDGEEDIPSNRFMLSSYHLGAIPSVPAGWKIWQYTGLVLPAPVNTSGGFVKQVSYSNDASLPARSAFQALGLVWGAYMRSSDIVDGSSSMAVTYKKNYDPATATSPFASSFKAKAALLVETDLAVSRYIESGTGAGQVSINIVLQDTESNKKLNLITRLFHKKGFTVAADDGSSKYTDHPSTPRIGEAFWKESLKISSLKEAIFYSHLGHDTLYNSFEKGSAMSQTATWTVNKHFAYTLNRDQFTKMITQANNLLAASDVKYSIGTHNYKMVHLDIRMEGSGVQQSSPTNKLEMSFKGKNFKVSTISWTNKGNALWGATSNTPGELPIGTAFYPGLTYDQFYLGIANLGSFGDAVSSSTTKAVKNFTGYDPYENSISVGSNKQLSVLPNKYGATAIQASGKEWAAYMRSADATFPEKNLSIRGGHVFDNARPFLSEYGENAVLHLSSDVTLPRYNATGTAKIKDPIGYAIFNIYFQDMRPESRKALLVTARIFDPRGFRVLEDDGKTLTATGSQHRIGGASLREVAVRCGSGEMGVGTQFSHGTTYITMDEDSELSQIAPWTTEKHFGFTISKGQFQKVIADSNKYLTDHEPTTATYSANLGDYRISLVDLGMEIAMREHPENKKVEMAIHGKDLKLWTTYTKP